MNRNGMSRHSVTAAPLMNSRMVSTPCTRAINTPVGRLSKKRGGNLNSCSNTCKPSTASMRLPVCSTSYCRTQVITVEKTMNTTKPMAITHSVLAV